jgi:glycine/D-amino acid oxidase-like deaminating enzyme
VPGGVAVHDAHGWWIAEALAAGPAPEPLPPLTSDLTVDVLVVGGGYTGLWTAWHVLAAEPQARVAVLEAGRCGFGPSGRNGGFVNSLWLSLPSLRARFGDEPAMRLALASRDSVGAIGEWCEAQGVDAWFQPAPHPVVSAAPAQDGVSAEAVDGDEIVAVTAEEVQGMCASPVLRGGVLVRTAATVQPARLAFGLRERLLGRGVRIFERSRVTSLAGAVARTDGGGEVRAGAAVVAVNARSGALRPLRHRLTVSSSHIVLTEPVPDVLDATGWRGGELISDGRALLHYLRTTRDDRILFGWAGGRMACGARAGGRMDVDAEIVAIAERDLRRFFPGLGARKVTHAWGGPIDVSPTHLPEVVSLPGGRAHAAFGFTGNGVGPSHLLGRTLAALALGTRDALTRLPLVDPAPTRVPPEPFRIAGATVIRRALVRREGLEERGRRPDPVTRAVTALPELLGMHIVR